MSTGLKWILVVLALLGTGYITGYKVCDSKYTAIALDSVNKDIEDMQHNLVVSKDVNKDIKQAEDEHYVNQKVFEQTNTNFTNRILQLGYDGMRYYSTEARVQEAEDNAAAARDKLRIETQKVTRLSKELRRVTEDYRKESLRANQVVNDFNECVVVLEAHRKLYNSLK